MRKQNELGVMRLVSEKVWEKHRSVLLCEQLFKENSSWSSYLTKGQTPESQRGLVLSILLYRESWRHEEGRNAVDTAFTCGKRDNRSERDIKSIT